VTDLTGNAVTGVGPYYQDITDAIKLFGERDYPGALKRLESAKKVTPALAPAEVMMAHLHFDAGQLGPAIAMLEKATRAAPQDPEAFVIFLERAAADGRATEGGLLFPKIEKLFDEFKDNPRRKQSLQVRAYSAGAVLSEVSGDLPGAVDKLTALVKLDPRNAASHTQLGRVLFAQGDKASRKKAFEEFKAAAEADKKSPPAELMMATLFNDKANAEQWLEFALKNSPQDIRTQIGAANFRLKTNQVNKAKEHATAALKLDPESYDGNLIVGLVARMDGDYATADKHLSKAHLLAPADMAVANHLALSLIELPDEASRARALQYAEMNARQKVSAESLATLGWVNYRLNRRLEADRAFTAAFNSKEVMATRSMTSEMAYFLANLAKSQGNTQEAINTLREALNTEQPFAYRKNAEKLLAELTKGAGATAAKTGAPVGGVPASSAPASSGSPESPTASKPESAKSDAAKAEAKP
jgi:tetratricopeptide (TPR) repeat protein